MGKFKVPVLRGRPARAPYFHDGSAATIHDVVEFYKGPPMAFKFRASADAPLQDITAEQEADLIAFLSSL